MPEISKVNKAFAYHLPILFKAAILRSFPFLFSAFPIKPKTASLNITDQCNLRCLMCKQWRQNKKSKELDTEQWKIIIRQLKEQGVKEINFTGGEPLLRKDIHNLVKYAKSLGIYCGITTNGTLLSEEEVDLLIASGIKTFTISIDALGDEYNNIRGVGNTFEKVRSAAEILSKGRSSGKVEVNISFVLMQKTLESFESVFEFCKNLNLPIVICLLDKTPYLFNLKNKQEDLWIQEKDYERLEEIQRALINSIKNKTNLVYNSISDVKFFKSYFKDPIQRNIPCAASQIRIFIDSSGEVFGGCWSMGSFGNLIEFSLKQIMNSKNFKENHKKMFFKKCPGCSCGYPTNLRYNLRSLIKNITLKKER